MPHFPHTPEALLGRNDSKNPSTTCKGITSNGRPCRRALASPRSSPLRRKSNGDALGGVVAIVQEDGEIEEADFYCWQHKDQAEQRVHEENQNTKGRRVKRRSTELFPLKEQSSIDTLVQRLGIDAASENNKPLRKTSNPKPPRRTETADFAGCRPPRPSKAPYAEKYSFGSSEKPNAKPQRRGFWSSLCCMSGGDDDYVEIVRHKKRVEQSRPPEMSAARPAQSLNMTSSIPASIPPRKPVAADSPARSSTQPSETNELLSLIPHHLSPQTTSALLTELTKPISPYDEEGYIYIFWLTPQSKAAPSDSMARSLLIPSRSRTQHARRISDVMTEYSYDGSDDIQASRVAGHTRTGTKTIMLKIGRANNVTRRMNEWQRQCGYALNLVRWYPYIPSSSTPSPQPSPQREILYPDLSKPPLASPTGRRESSGVHRVPNVKRVERLIHLELAERQVKRQCTACGKEHREWFEVEASQAGVKSVDETVRRWVGWVERQAMNRE